MGLTTTQGGNLKFLKLTEVKELTKLSRSLIYKKIQLGEFPKQVKASDNSTVWVEQEIFEWMESRIQNRNEQQLERGV